MDAREHNALATCPVRIGAMMRAHRLAQKLKAADVARVIGIARPNYCRCERGKHQQQLWIVARFCDALGIRVVDFSDADRRPGLWRF